MAHRDLLPTGFDFRESLEEEGLSSSQSYAATSAVTYHLRLWADYHKDEYDMVGMQQDQGASDALHGLANACAEASAGQAPSAFRPPTEETLRGNAELQAVISDAIRYVTVGQSIDQAALEVLSRLETAGYTLLRE